MSNLLTKRAGNTCVQLAPNTYERLFVPANLNADPLQTGEKKHDQTPYRDVSGARPLAEDLFLLGLVATVISAALIAEVVALAPMFSGGLQMLATLLQ